MAITNSQSGTNVHEVADGIYRISTPVMIKGAGVFSFNQYLILDDEPLLFHTGPRKLFPHEWLAAAPQSVPLCGTVAAMVSIADETWIYITMTRGSWKDYRWHGI